MNFFAFSAAINGITAITLGSVVLYKKPASPRARIFFLFWFSVFFWSFCYLFWQLSSDAASALRWVKGLMLAAVLIPGCLLHYTLTLVNIKDKRILLFAVYASCVLLAISDVINLIVAGVRPKAGFAFWPDTGPLFHLHFAIFAGCVLYSIYLMLAHLSEAHGDQVQQLKYSIVGTVLGFGGGMTNYFLWYDIPIKPYGNICVSIYTCLIAYTILKYRLMDIEFVIRRALLYSILSTVLIAMYVVIASMMARHIEDFALTQNMYTSALLAGLIALFFDPLRKWMQIRLERPEIERQVSGELLHETKTPLANITLPAELSYGDIARVLNGTARAEDVLPQVQDRIQFIIDQVSLAGQRAEAVHGLFDSDPAARTSVRIQDLVEQSLARIRQGLDQAGIRMQQNLPADLPSVHADRRQLEIVFVNLFKNAMEAIVAQTSGPREIHISAIVEGKSLVVEVQDSGPGIPKEIQKKIFDQSFSTKGKKGAGVGLYISREIIKAHGGTLQLKSEVLEGATFVVRIPIERVS